MFEVIYRETIGRFLSGLILCAGYFMIGLQKEKCGLHDLMSDTRVVYCHKKDVVIETPVQYREIQQIYTQATYQLPTQNVMQTVVPAEVEEVQEAEEQAVVEIVEE